MSITFPRQRLGSQFSLKMLHSDFALIGTARVPPSTITVTNLADAGPGSLRAALATADALPGKDTINFHLPAPPVNSENIIALTGGALTSKGDVTITGPGAGKLIINGNAADGVFVFDDSNLAIDSPVTISGLSIVNGNSAAFGGGIVSAESLNLKNVVVSGNQASQDGGGIWVSGLQGALCQHHELLDRP